MQFQPKTIATRSEQDLLLSLRRSRRLATGLLLVMTLLFAVSKYYEAQIPSLAWLRAFTEASMVGALADWFAVTALFRHPLGLPLPHTAIIPSNQERIGHSLGEFFQSNFLSPEAVSSKLAEFKFGHQMGIWLNNSDNAAWLSREFTKIIPQILAALDEKEIQGFLGARAHSMIQDLNLAHIAGVSLETLYQSDSEQALQTEVIKFINSLLQENRGLLKDLIAKIMPWYVPNLVHDAVFESMTYNMEKLLLAMEQNPQHEFRPQISQAVYGFCEKLKTSEDFARQSEVVKAWILKSESLRNVISKLIGKIHLALEEDCASEHSWVSDTIERLVHEFSAALIADASIQSRIDSWVSHACTSLLEEHGKTISQFIATTVKGWDSRTIIQKLELEVGRDLQFIRINGTIVGGLVGLLLHLAVG